MQDRKLRGIGGRATPPEYGNYHNSNRSSLTGRSLISACASTQFNTRERMARFAGGGTNTRSLATDLHGLIRILRGHFKDNPWLMFWEADNKKGVA
jgi:hypothetical protein